MPATTFAGFDLRQLTFPTVVAAQAMKYADKTFLTYLPDGRSYSYGECHRLSNRLANGFARANITAHMSVAILMENCPEQFLTYFALGKIGAVAVPINSASKADLLRHFITDSRSTFIVTQHQFVSRIADIVESLPWTVTVISVPDGETVLDPSWPWRDFAGFMDADDGNPEASVDCTDEALVMYTSGTTGRSKGTVYTQARAWLYNIQSIELHRFHEDDVYYVCLPLFHTNGFLSCCLQMWLAGGSVALARRFSASRFWPEICASGSTIGSVLGAMGDILWKLPPSAAERQHKLRIMRWSTTQSPKEFEERYGLKLFSSYGLSDYGVATVRTSEDGLEKGRSAGRPRPGWRVRIVDDLDCEVPAGATGEIVLQCEIPWMAWGGYLNLPDETLRSLRNGWFHTGDLGYLDPEGYLWFSGRMKDSIRRRGENISAFEVEQIIGRHPQISEVAVYGIKSEMSEDEVAATIVLKEGASLSPVDLLDFCQKEMSYFMVPRYIEFAREIPKTGTQKLAKQSLKEDAEKNKEKFWDRERSDVKLLHR